MNCGIGRDCGSNLIPGLETPQAAGLPKMKNKKKKEKEKSGYQTHHIYYLILSFQHH